MDLKSVGSPVLWIGFTVLILGLLAFDLGVLHRRNRELTMSQALKYTGVWVGVAAVFNLWVYLEFGHVKGLEFTTGYLIEEALSVDNLFVFIVIFSYFGVPKLLQHRVLFWGILGALIMRGLFIGLGTALIQTFQWIEYVFGAILLFTAYKLLFQGDEPPSPEKNPALRLFQRIIPSVDTYHENHFVIKRDGKRYATPLLMVLLVIEATDVVFAVDSIPAIFSITVDPFIVYTSNIFAILGLRSLYFVLAGMMNKFHYLKFGLGIVLAFVGAKMVISDFFHVPVWASLMVIASVLAISVVASLMRPEAKGPAPTE